MLNVHTRELGGHMKDVLFRPITFEKYRKPQVVEYPRHAIVLNPHHTRQQQQQQQKHLEENNDDNDNDSGTPHTTNARRFLISEIHHRNQSLSHDDEQEGSIEANNNNHHYNKELNDSEEEDESEEDKVEEEEGNPYHLDKNDKLCSNDAFLSIVQTCGKWQVIRPVGRGLVNLGNTCFANSVLQCFSYVPMLAQEMCNTYRASDNQLGAPYDFAFALAETIREIHGIRNTTPSPNPSSSSSSSRYAVGNGRQSVILSSSVQNTNNNGRNTFTSTTPTSSSSASPAANNQMQQYNYQSSSNTNNNLHYHHSNGNAYRPGKIIGFLKTLSPRFTPGRQCDAHEFAMQLLSACQKCILFRHVGNRKLPQLVAQSTSLYRICAGYLRSQVSWSLEEEVAQLIKSDRRQVAMDLQMEQASHVNHNTRNTTTNKNKNISNNVKKEEIQMLHSNTYELFTILSVDLVGKTLSQCLDRFFAPEQLHGRCYHTPREIPVYAHKEYKLHLPPAVLMLQLKRFDGAGRKVSKMVEYPLELDVTEYCTPAAIKVVHKERQRCERNTCTKHKISNSNNNRFQMNQRYNNFMPSNYCNNNGWHHSEEPENFPTQIRLSEVNKLRKVQQQRSFSLANKNAIKLEEEEYEEEEYKQMKNLYRYELSAICVHEGNSLHFGHYYAVVKAANGMWYVCNDIQVHTISEEKALHMQAYMLFYSRIMPETVSETTTTSTPLNYNNNNINNNTCTKITKTTKSTSTLSLPAGKDNGCTINSNNNNSLILNKNTNNKFNNNNNQNMSLNNNYLDSDAMLGRALTAEEEEAAVFARRQANNVKTKDEKLADTSIKTTTTTTSLLQKEETPTPSSSSSSSSASQTVNNINAKTTNTDHNSNQHFLRDKFALKRFREEMETESDSDEQLSTSENNNNNNTNNNSNHIDIENECSNVDNKISKGDIMPEHQSLARTGRDAVRSLEHTRHDLAPSSTQRPARAPQFQQRIRDPM